MSCHRLHMRHAQCRLLPARIPTTSRQFESSSNVDGNNFGGWAGGDQWSTGRTPEMGRRCNFHRPRDGLARHGDRKHRSPGNRCRSSRRPIRSHLGSECLPDCDGRNPFAAGSAWRGRRSPQDLPRRPCTVYGGIAFLRRRLVVAQPADSACAAAPPGPVA